MTDRMTIRVSPEFRSRIMKLTGPGAPFPSSSCAIMRLAAAADRLLQKRDPEIMAELLGVGEYD